MQGWSLISCLFFLVLPGDITVSPPEALLSGSISALTDGLVPPFSLESDDNLLLLTYRSDQPPQLIFDFTNENRNFGDSQHNAIELVMFNCPQMNAGVSSVLGSGMRSGGNVISTGETNVTAVGCSGFVHVCVPSPNFPVQNLMFASRPTSSPNVTVVLRIAEIIFHNNNSRVSTCPSALRLSGE